MTARRRGTSSDGATGRGPTSEQLEHHHHRLPARHRHFRLIGTVLILVLLVALVIWQRDRLSDLPEALLQARWHLVVIAVAAQAVSMAALAREQRRLLAIGGQQVPLLSVMGTVYAGTAISVTLPMIGSATAAFFSFRRFVQAGVDAPVAAWVLAVSGIYSTVTLALITSTGALMAATPVSAIGGALTLLVAVLPVTILLATIHRPRMRQLLELFLSLTLLRIECVVGWPRAELRGAMLRAIDRFASLALTRRSALLAAGSAVINWIADIACLALSLLAVHAVLPWSYLVLIWAAGVGVLALGLTPGGVGVVELTLSAGLIGAGVPAGTALAGVVIYRAIRLWLVVLAGGITLLVINWRRSYGQRLNG